MSKEAVFTMKLEHSLRDEFMAAAAQIHRPASQLVRDFMREFIQKQREKHEYDAWFKKEVKASLDDQSPTLSHEQVMTEMKSRLTARVAETKK